MLQPTPLPDDQFRRIIGPLNASSTGRQEGREFPRFAVRAAAKCQGLDDTGLPIGVPFKANVMNISQGGALLDTGSMCDAPLIHVQIMEDHQMLAETIIAVVRVGAGTVAGYFVKKPAVSP